MQAIAGCELYTNLSINPYFNIGHTTNLYIPYIY